MRDRRARHVLGGVLTLALAMTLTVGVAAPPASGKEVPPEVKKMIQKLQALTPQKGYLKAHADLEKPFEPLGGPVEVSVTQDSGGVFVALPDKRKLDEDVFGTPEMPRSFGGTPGITGVPPKFRNHEGGEYTTLKKMTPFGDKFTIMKNGELELTALDATATDAATTDDEVQMVAKWQDKKGNTYEVRAGKVIPHGLEFPVFGGVVTNHILHGWSRLGTPLMPTEFTYLAFWAIGEVRKNGEVVDKPRIVHGMLTEYVRKEGYKLAKDSEITPGRRHFHLMVSPFMPNKEKGHFVHDNVKTGFKLPNGKTLPFWHVMFETLDIESSRK